MHARAAPALPKVAPVGLCAWTLLLRGSPPTGPLADSWVEAAHLPQARPSVAAVKEVIRKEQSLTGCRTLCPLPGSVFASFAKMCGYTVHVYQDVIASATDPGGPSLWEMWLGASGPTCSTVTTVLCVWAVMVTRAPLHWAPWHGTCELLRTHCPTETYHTPGREILLQLFTFYRSGKRGSLPEQWGVCRYEGSF